MKLIKLTSWGNGSPIWVNIDTIGHIYTDTKEQYGKTSSYTVVGTTCHNNGGFKVHDTPEKIFDLISEAKPYEFKK